MRRASHQFFLLLAIIGGLGVGHLLFSPEISPRKDAFQQWFERLQQEASLEENLSVVVEIAAGQGELQKRWRVDSARGEESLLLRVLTLIHEGKLYQQSGEGSEALRIQIHAAEYSADASTPWSSIQKNIPAQNLLVLLNAIGEQSESAHEDLPRKEIVDENTR